MQRCTIGAIVLASIFAVSAGVMLWRQIQGTIADTQSVFLRERIHRPTVLKQGFLGNNTVSTENLSASLLALREGEVALLRGEWRRAEEAFARSTELGGGIPALRKLASTQLQRRSYRDARQTISRLKDASGSTPDVALLLGILELLEGRTTLARSIFERVQNSPQGRYGLAMIAITEQDHTLARSFLEEVHSGNDTTLQTAAGLLLAAYDEYNLFPKSPADHRTTLIARALADVGSCEIALPLLKDVTSRRDSYRDAWIVRGYCELTSERLSDAISSLEHSYDIDPEKPETSYFLARTYALKGDPGNAVKYLQYAIANGVEPQQDAHLLLANYARELGNISLAVSEFGIVANDPETKDIGPAKAYIELGLTMKNSDLEALLSTAQTTVKKWPESAESHILLARALFAMQRRDEARKALETALQIQPGLSAAVELQREMK